MNPYKIKNGEDEKMEGGENHEEGGGEEKKQEGEGGEKDRQNEEGGEKPEGVDGKEQEGDGGGEQEGEEGGVVQEEPLTSLLVLELECPVCLSPMVGSAPAPPAVGPTCPFGLHPHALSL